MREQIEALIAELREPRTLPGGLTYMSTDRVDIANRLTAILAALRRPEPAADVVEAVAMAIYEELWKGRANWEGISGLEREQCSALARAALAALAAAQEGP